MKNRLLELLFVRATVGDVTATGRFRRIVLRAEPLRTAGWQPGQQVRVDVGPATALAPLLRTYSVWDRHDDAIELQGLLHGDGPGARWLAAAAPGTEVLLSKPKGDFVLRPAPWHLFVGEETASVAFGAMLRALPAGSTGRAVVECGDDADRLPLPGAVDWTGRGGLLAAVEALTLPAEPGTAYVAGEARDVQAVRRHLVHERGWPRRSVLTKPFWTPGKKGME
ncbi:siderophore-interacting protein [Dactylosporangium sp. NPDC005555]|uniref:siderophore-interacting protein n=1 Tax=Dactylosporangium sp. NPDC005555 TaxID=3154889 RepID=UPI0033B826D5